MRKIHLIGDSHVLGLLALQKNKNLLNEYVISHFPGGGLKELLHSNDGNAYSELFRSLLPDDVSTPVVLLLGNELYNSKYSYCTMEWKERRAFSIDYNGQVVGECGPIVSIDTVTNLLREEYQKYYLPLLKLLKKEHRNVYFLSGPSVTKDSSVLDQMLTKKRGFDMFIQESRLRLVANQMSKAIFGNMLAEYDIPFIDLSSVVSDEEGYLKEEYYHDGVHGNQRYAMCVAQKLDDYLEQAHEG